MWGGREGIVKLDASLANLLTSIGKKVEGDGRGLGMSGSIRMKISKIFDS